jgi:hypothetical protein
MEIMEISEDTKAAAIAKGVDSFISAVKEDTFPQECI